MSSKYIEAMKKYEVTVVNEPQREFYVYRYSVDDTPFYIGVGAGYRYLAHLVASHSQFMRRKMTKLRREAIPFEVKIVYHTNCRDRAIQKEIELIARYGRRGHGGTLVNATSGGDGGNTTGGKLRYYHPKTREQSVFPEGKQPKGWKLGIPAESTTKGYKDYYNPKTDAHKRVAPGEKPPKGWVRGRPHKGNTGPKGKIIISNPKTGEHQWVLPGTKIPKGWVHGRSHEGSTLGRVAWHNPATAKKVYLPEGERPPKGWVKGLKPTTGHSVMVGKKKFPSVQAAMEHFNTSRYLLCKRPDFKQLEN